MIITTLPDEVIDDLWLIFEPWLAAAAKVAGELYTVDDIRDRIQSRELGLWVVIDDQNNDVPIACYTTRIINYPRGRGMSVDFVGGRDVSEWFGDMSEMVEKYARDMECTHLEGGGRKGWLPTLKQHGWHEVFAFRKNL